MNPPIPPEGESQGTPATGAAVVDVVPPSRQHKDIKYPIDPKLVPALSNITYSEALQFPNSELERLPDVEKHEDQTIGENVIVPSYALWFSLDDVHEIEIKNFADILGPHADAGPLAKQSSVENLPVSNAIEAEALAQENFVQKSLRTDILRESYLKVRNFMVNFYRSSPTVYLTVTAVRRHIAVDVSLIIRVFTFLEQWGLINYQVDLVNKPLQMTQIDTRHYKLLAKTAKGNKLVQVGPGPHLSVSSTIEETMQSAPSLSDDISMSTENIELRKSIFEDDSMDAQESEDVMGLDPKAQLLYCEVCGAQLKHGYYHCVKVPSLNLCTSCYSEGRFSSSLYSADFVLLSPALASISAPALADSSHWTDQEILYLLEGLEMYGAEDWDSIAKHVSGYSSASQPSSVPSLKKSREDCIAKFLQLPIIDKFTSPSCASSSIAALNPILNSENPVMAIVSFLASLVHPNVASAVAKAAILEYQKLSEGNPADVNIGRQDTEQVAAKIMQDATDKARSLIAVEDEKINQSLYLLFEVFAKKIEMKLSQLQNLEESLANEKVELEKQKLAVIEQRVSLSAAMEKLKASSNYVPPEASSDAVMADGN